MVLYEMFKNCTHPCSQPRSRHKTFLAKPPGGHAWPIETGFECFKARRFCQECFVFGSGLRTWVCAVCEERDRKYFFLLVFNLLIYLSNNTILYRRLREVKITKTLKSGSRDGEKQMLQALPLGSLH